ncbi:MAG: hypothetical protein H0V44_05480 [Planctomycetes bacterium]|nr:hypothetical protein [Planctomycetota bacterium]
MRLAPTLSGIALTALATAAGASERLFTYTYESAVLAPGDRELELWTTYRHGRRYYYRRVDERAEFEVGVTERLQTAFYLNFSSKTQAALDASGNPTYDPTTGEAILEHESGVEGVSWEWKYKISDAVADAFGSAAYIEFSLGAEEYEVELKGILDKKIGDDLVAFNLSYEAEWAFEPGFNRPEHFIEADLGWSHRLGGGLAAGLEVRSVSEYEYDRGESSYELAHSALFAGPVVHYTSPSFWATLTVLPQVHAFQSEVANDDRLELEARERIEARLLFGTKF